MANLDAPAVARLLLELGQRIELAGESPYKARAYERAAQSLMTLTIPLDAVIAQGRLREIPGVGQAIAQKIFNFQTTGTDPTLERLRREAPSSLLTLLRIPGLSAQKVMQLYKQVGITSLDELEAACRADRLRSEPGFGPAMQAKILQGIEMMARSRGHRLIHHATEFLRGVEANLKRSHPALRRITAAGDVRRGCELVGDLSLVAEMPDAQGKGSVRLGQDITLHVSDRDRYGATLLLATGSPGHVEALQAAARRQGLTLDDEGLRRGPDVVASRTEKDIYAALGLPFIEPELREGAGEVELAAARKLPKLVKDADIRGLLHCHTDFSDGGDTLEAMAEATRQRGYGYFGVADHSQTARYAGGMTMDEVAAQHALADVLNEEYGDDFRIFKGIESDILEDGALDYHDPVLDSFDFVVASVHSRFRLDAERQTARILRAVANPHTTILGHMTGRMLLRRPGYEVDVEAVLEACAEHGVAVEINANPHRLDLDWRWLRRALDLGCMLSINPDAHSTAELDLTRWGVAMARKGGVPKTRVLNCLDRERFTAYLARRKRARAPSGSAQSKGAGP